MSQNPLQSFFRQPKIYVSLPSKGIYNKLGSFQGDPTNVPIFSMTGADEILMKTPDALYSGEATVKLFESCCPAIKDGWEISSLDSELLLTAIRIATNGNKLALVHQCPHCGELNDYDADLSIIVDHYASCKYENKIVMKDFTIKLQPLTYRENNDFSQRNFKIQQRLRSIENLTDEDRKKEIINNVYKELSIIQNEIYTACIESIDIGTAMVTEKEFILEWIQNSDKSIIDAIKVIFNKNKELWKVPTVKVKCFDCNKDSELLIELDQSNFFGNA
jgi:hypothetical protein